MTEILFGIRVIKFYNWEPRFAQKVGVCREQELSHLKAIKYLDAMCVYTWAALPVVISILTFITFVLLGHQLTAAKVGEGARIPSATVLPSGNFSKSRTTVEIILCSSVRVNQLFHVNLKSDDG